ncbi:unnamed protein product, partial [Effrenium voratum]
SARRLHRLRVGDRRAERGRDPALGAVGEHQRLPTTFGSVRRLRGTDEGRLLSNGRLRAHRPQIGRSAHGEPGDR